MLRMCGWNEDGGYFGHTNFLQGPTHLKWPRDEASAHSHVVEGTTQTDDQDWALRIST